MDTPNPGEIVTDDAGNVTIGLPTAVSFGEAIIPDGEQEDED